jgi:hypothetical protein
MVYTRDIIEATDTAKTLDRILDEFAFDPHISFENPFPNEKYGLSGVYRQIDQFSRLDYLSKEKNWLKPGFTFAKIDVPDIQMPVIQTQNSSTVNLANILLPKELIKSTNEEYAALKEAVNDYHGSLEEFCKNIQVIIALGRLRAIDQFQPDSIYQTKIAGNNDIKGG